MKQSEGLNMTGNSTNKGIDARNLTLPVLTIISLIGFVIWITYIFTTELSITRSRLNTIENTLIEVKEKLKTFGDGRLGQDRAGRKYITNDDLTVFCLRAQLMNKDWRCPSLEQKDSLNRYNDVDVMEEINRLNGINTETTKQ